MLEKISYHIWRKFLFLRYGPKYLVGMVINGCVYFGSRALELAVSHKETNEIRKA